MTFLHNWRMPLLFILFRAGTYFAPAKRIPDQYLDERFNCHFIPLAAWIFILVPVQVYIEKASICSLLDFYSHMLESIYPQCSFSWNHLWFIAYLFVIVLLISTFLVLIRGKKFARFIYWIEVNVTNPLELNIFIIPLMLSQILLRKYSDFGTNALVNDWFSMAFYIIFFIAGFVRMSTKNIAEAVRKQPLLYLAETNNFFSKMEQKAFWQEYSLNQ